MWVSPLSLFPTERYGMSSSCVAPKGKERKYKGGRDPRRVNEYFISVGLLLEVSFKVWAN